MTLPDRDGYESAAMYAAERKAREPWDQTVIHYVEDAGTILTPCGIDPNEWRMGATIKSASILQMISCQSCLANLALRWKNAGKVAPLFAHQVFPDPVKPEYIHTSEAENSGLAEQMAKYHAARAWAFHLASLEGHLTAASVSLLVTEFHLARLYFLLCTTDHPHHHLDRIAALIGTTQRWQPQNVAPEILEILEWAEIDPTTIRAYKA
jgi:hypothetical protein